MRAGLSTEEYFIFQIAEAFAHGWCCNNYGKDKYLFIVEERATQNLAWGGGVAIKKKAMSQTGAEEREKKSQMMLSVSLLSCVWLCLILSIRTEIWTEVMDVAFVCALG